VPVKQEGTTDGKKYSKYFKKLEAKAPARQSDGAISGKMSRTSVNVAMEIHNKPGEWNKGAHAHPYNECLCSSGMT
jgi:hypothetical protein